MDITDGRESSWCVVDDWLPALACLSVGFNIPTKCFYGRKG